jgi:hypothetical protein
MDFARASYLLKRTTCKGGAQLFFTLYPPDMLRVNYT